MSRPIKFRVWDLTNQEWCGYGENHENRIMDLEYSMEVGAFMFDNDNYDFDRKHKYIIEQFTGLLDKNGKEIYEGDIIKGGWNGANHINHDEICVVRFVQGIPAFVLNVLPREIRFEWFYHTTSTNIEVIGNIHEKSEEKEGKK